MFLSVKLAVDGNFSSWSAWGQCSRTCGGGQKRRTRSCTNPPPSKCGQSCFGNTEELADCNTHSCPGKNNFTLYCTLISKSRQARPFSLFQETLVSFLTGSPLLVFLTFIWRAYKSCSVRCTSKQVIRTRSHGRGIALCYWARRFTLILSLFRCKKWVPENVIL